MRPGIRRAGASNSEVGPVGGGAAPNIVSIDGRVIVCGFVGLEIYSDGPPDNDVFANIAVVGDRMSPSNEFLLISECQVLLRFCISSSSTEVSIDSLLEEA